MRNTRPPAKSTSATVPIRLRVPRAYLRRLRGIARRTQTPVSKIVATALAALLELPPGPEPPPRRPATASGRRASSPARHHPRKKAA
jgi:hypothetical protein